MRLRSSRIVQICILVMLCFLLVILASSAADRSRFTLRQLEIWWLALGLALLPYIVILVLFLQGRERAAVALSLGAALGAMASVFYPVDYLFEPVYYGASGALYLLGFPAAAVLVGLAVVIAASHALWLTRHDPARPPAVALALAALLAVGGISYTSYRAAPRQDMDENSRGALAAMRAIDMAQLTYSAVYGERGAGFAPSLAALGPPREGQRSAQAADLIDAALAQGEKYGYRFSYVPGPAEQGVIRRYSLTARPLAYRNHGPRSFYTDESGVVRFTPENRDATAQDPPVE